MPTAGPRASEVFCDLIEPYIAVVHLQQQVQGTLQPYVKATHTSGFDQYIVVQIPKGNIFKPRHQKSSAEGMRLYAIFPPA